MPETKLKKSVVRRPTESVTGLLGLILLTLKAGFGFKFTTEQEYVLIAWWAAAPGIITTVVLFFRKFRNVEDPVTEAQDG